MIDFKTTLHMTSGKGNANKQLSVSKKNCFKYMISMIKAKVSFFELQIQEVMVRMVTRTPFCI